MPKIIPALTSAQVMNAKAPPGKRLRLRDGKVSGLALTIYSTGKRVWSLRVTESGRRVWQDVGRDLSLSDARAAAEEILKKLREGEDLPRPRRELLGRKTFADVIEAYEALDGGAKKTWKDQKNRLRSVFASLLSESAFNLAERDFLRAADAHPTRSTAESAMRFVRPLIKWAARREFMKKGVAEEIQTKQTKRRKRVLDNDELHRVLKALSESGQDRGVRFLLWTLPRRSEMERAVWAQIDLKSATWTIPADHRKNPKGLELDDLVIPLPRQAVAMLRLMAKDADKGLVFRSPEGAPLGNWTRWQAAMNEASKTEGWHRHDLRRTGATLAGRLGVPPHIVEMMLGHAQPHSEIAGVYNLSRYAPEHRKGLQKLADALDRIERGEQNVVAFKRS
jgi:site-specific recombinase XerD